jgi:hypothetical protein
MMTLMLPRLKLNVAITLAGGPAYPEKGSIFLESSSPVHRGTERVEEFLNLRRERFFPFLKDENALIFLVNRSRILYLVEPTISEEPVIGPPAIIYLTDGSRHEVTMISDLPSDHARLQDYLNLDQPFLSFQIQDSLIHFNKNHIAQVTEHE